MLFHKKLLALHRDHAADNLHKSDFLMRFAADDIIDHIKLLDRDFTDVIELGGRIGHLSDFLIKSNPDYLVTDFSQKMLDKNPAQKTLLLQIDEALPFAGNSADLIVSSMNLHWINDVPTFIKEIYNILKPEGVFIANFIGAGSLDNLKKLLIQIESSAGLPHYMHVAPLISAENTYKLFQAAGFSFITVGTQKLDLEYDNPVRLLKELKNMGENNAMTTTISPLPRAILSCNEIFEDRLVVVTVVVKKIVAQNRHHLA